MSSTILKTPPELIEQIRQIVTAAGGAFDGIQESLDTRFPEVVFQSVDVACIHLLPFNPEKFNPEKFSRLVREELKDTAIAARQEKKNMTSSLKEKLYKVYEAIEFIEKNGENTSQHYEYIKAADVTRAIRKAFIEHRIYAEINYDFVGAPYTIARAKEPNAPFSAVNVKCSAVFYDLDSEETKTASGLGSGADTGDKAAYKAQTGALKYCLKNAFLVPDEADPEADPTVDEGNTSSRSPEKMPDFQAAQHAAPKAVTTKKETSRPQPPAVPAKVAPKAESAPAVAPAAAPAAPVAPTAAPERGDAYEGPDENPTALPTEAELAEYRKKFKDLGDDLTTTGKMKASKGLPVNRKLLVFLLQITKAQKAAEITKAQWNHFFDRVAVGKNNPAVGLVGIATLINKANGIDEKQK